MKKDVKREREFSTTGGRELCFTRDSVFADLFRIFNDPR